MIQRIAYAVWSAIVALVVLWMFVQLFRYGLE